MEETPSPASPQSARSTAANPFMDVVAPPANSASADEGSSAPTPASAEVQAQTPLPTTLPAAHQKSQAKPKKSKAAGVNTAIFATVIIVLGLAVLAVYAYLKQK